MPQKHAFFNLRVYVFSSYSYSSWFSASKNIYTDALSISSRYEFDRWMCPTLSPASIRLNNFLILEDIDVLWLTLWHTMYVECPGSISAHLITISKYAVHLKFEKIATWVYDNNSVFSCIIKSYRHRKCKTHAKILNSSISSWRGVKIDFWRYFEI